MCTRVLQPHPNSPCVIAGGGIAMADLIFSRSSSQGSHVIAISEVMQMKWCAGIRGIFISCCTLSYGRRLVLISLRLLVLIGPASCSM